jgi:hypothetical protein
MGVIDSVRRRNDSRVANAFAQPEGATPENGAADITDTNSEDLSLGEKDEKELVAHGDQVTADAHLGVQKAEAAALVWPKTAVYATYLW